MKSCRKIALCMGWAMLIVALAGLIWCWSVSSLFHDMADTPYKYEETFSSPGGAGVVTVWRSDAVWSFGPASAKVVATLGTAEEVYETEIGDDGGRGRVDVCWLDDDTAQITLSGQEQKDEIVTVAFSDPIQLTTNKLTTKEGA